MAKVKVTHFIPYDSPPSRTIRLALCGAYVPVRDHASTPTCPDCLRERAAYNALNLDGHDPVATMGGAH